MALGEAGATHERLPFSIFHRFWSLALKLGSLLLALWLGVILMACSVGAQESPGPWLLHPLEPPSQLALSNLRLHLDYRGREQTGCVALTCEADLKNSGDSACNEQMMLVCADSGSRLSMNGKELAQERLVMPVPGSGLGEMTRVSIFRVILLSGERGHLVFRSQQKLDFLSPNRHRVRLILPVHRAWREAGDARLKVDLTPELSLLKADHYQVKNGTAERRLSRFVKSTEVVVEARMDPTGWGGAAWATPSMRRAWIWGGLAALVGVTLGALGRFGWLAAVPVAMIVNWALRQNDPGLQQWTYYREASQFRIALQLQYYFVPLWTMFGTMGGVLLGYRVRSKEDA